MDLAPTGSTTFDDLLRRAAWRWPDAPFVWWSDRDRTITFAEADALADRAAAVGIRSRWDVNAVLDAVEARGVTYMPANPFLLREVLDVCRTRGNRPESLRVVVTGGGPVPPELKRAFVEELSLPFCESYGQSELGGFVALGSPSRPPALASDTFLAVGPVLPDREVMIMRADGTEAAPGDPGEIAVRGGVMWGYWELPDKTAEAVLGGWLHTGDTGRMDLDGNVTVLGRWSERIEVDGDVVFPRPFEEALLRHPAVFRAAVIAVDDPAHGAVPVAFVELAPASAEVDAVAILNWYRAEADVDQRLADVRLVAPMPMTPTGKLDKVTLRRSA